MRLIKMLPVIGLCAASFLPATAVADMHAVQIVNASSKQCLDATSEGGFVQQSMCEKGKKGQQWHIKGNRIVNQNWPNQCLDIYVVDVHPLLNTVQTDACEDWKKAQQWIVGPIIRNEYTGQCIVAPGDRKLGPIKALRCDRFEGFEIWEIKGVK